MNLDKRITEIHWGDKLTNGQRQAIKALINDCIDHVIGEDEYEVQYFKTGNPKAPNYSLIARDELRATQRQRKTDLVGEKLVACDKEGKNIMWYGKPESKLEGRG